MGIAPSAEARLRSQALEILLTPHDAAWLRAQVLELLQRLPITLDTAHWITPGGWVPISELVVYVREGLLPPPVYKTVDVSSWGDIDNVIRAVVDRLEAEGRVERYEHTPNCPSIQCVRQISLLEAVARAAEADRAEPQVLGQTDGDPPHLR